jgi:hypothetical protein
VAVEEEQFFVGIEVGLEDELLPGLPTDHVVRLPEILVWGVDWVLLGPPPPSLPSRNHCNA